MLWTNHIGSRRENGHISILIFLGNWKLLILKIVVNYLFKCNFKELIAIFKPLHVHGKKIQNYPISDFPFPEATLFTVCILFQKYFSLSFFLYLTLIVRKCLSMAWPQTFSCVGSIALYWCINKALSFRLFQLLCYYKHCCPEHSSTSLSLFYMQAFL